MLLICWIVLMQAGYASTNDYPQWWLDQGVISSDTNATPNDFAVANQGQLKWIATQCANELALNLSPSEEIGSKIQSLLDSFTYADNNATLNQGQLKNAAEPFYDRLYELGATNAYPPGTTGKYPWTEDAGDDASHTAANVGQLKHLFNLNIGYLLLDTDGDGLPDWWEQKYGLNPFDSSDGAKDADGDGVTNQEEYQNGTHPRITNVSPPTGARGRLLYRYDISGRLTDAHFNSTSALWLNSTPADNITTNTVFTIGQENE